MVDSLIKPGTIPEGFCRGMNTLYAYLENKTKKTMKEKKAFVEFEHLDRKMTIAIVAIDEIVHVGLSIQNPEDTYDKSLGRRIAEGRACNNPLVDVFDLSEPYCFDYGILKSIGYHMKSRVIKHLTFDKDNKRWNYDKI